MSSKTSLQANFVLVAAATAATATVVVDWITDNDRNHWIKTLLSEGVKRK